MHLRFSEETKHLMQQRGYSPCLALQRRHALRRRLALMH